MSKRITRISVVALVLALFSFALFSVKAFANEIETPADDPVIEEYDEVFSHYHNYHDTNIYPTYDSFYLISSNYDDFYEDISGWDYTSITVEIYVRLSVNYITCPFNVAVKNWHTSPNSYAYKTLNLNNYYSTHTYKYTFKHDIAHISNSLCLYFTCSNGNPTLYDVDAYITYGYETISSASLVYDGIYS